MYSAYPPRPSGYPSAQHQGAPFPAAALVLEIEKERALRHRHQTTALVLALLLGIALAASAALVWRTSKLGSERAAAEEERAGMKASFLAEAAKTKQLAADLDAARADVAKRSEDVKRAEQRAADAEAKFKALVAASKGEPEPAATVRQSAGGGMVCAKWDNGVCREWGYAGKGM